MPLRQSIGNGLLDAISSHELAALAPHLQHATLARGQSIFRAGERLSRVYFPVTSVLSAVAVMRDGAMAEIGTIGREGMVGVQAALGVDRIPSEVLCQIPGTAKSVEVKDFISLIEALPTLRFLVYRYTQSLLNFMGQTIACSSLHPLLERCARWLLLTADRVASDEFLLTQEFLAIMLGVRRPGVTAAARSLQGLGLISYRRGRIQILNRVGLEEASCECYRIMADDFERLLVIPPSQDLAAGKDSDRE